MVARGIDSSNVKLGASMLSFQITDSGRKINVYCDAKGMAILLGALAKLVGERASHLHLWTAAAPGGVLSEKTPWGDDAVPEVIINYAEGDQEYSI
jgi:hypothetical protein